MGKFGKSERRLFVVSFSLHISFTVLDFFILVISSPLTDQLILVNRSVSKNMCKIYFCEAFLSRKLKNYMNLLGFLGVVLVLANSSKL